MKKRSALKNYEIKYSIDETSKVAKWSWYQIIETAIINVQPTNQYIYIYIYKSRDLKRENMRFCHIAHFMKIIKIFLSHIEDKNKFKNRLFISFGLIFQDNFLLYFLFNILKLPFVSFGSMF